MSELQSFDGNELLRLIAVLRADGRPSAIAAAVVYETGLEQAIDAGGGPVIWRELEDGETAAVFQAIDTLDREGKGISPGLAGMREAIGRQLAHSLLPTSLKE